MKARALTLILIAATIPTMAQAAKRTTGHETFVPRLLKAIDDDLRAHDACLRREIAPVAGQDAAQIAHGAIERCRRSDSAVVAAERRVRGFPSVENFWAGTDEKIFTFAERLAKVRMAAKSPWPFW